jgi:IS605 OrfB family transposase
MISSTRKSSRIIQQYGTIFVEDLNVGGLSRGMFAKSVHDASWSSFLNKLCYKAEHAGRRFVQVNPRGTSQRCRCGADNPKKLSDRERVCTECGLLQSVPFGTDFQRSQLLRCGRRWRGGRELRAQGWGRIAVSCLPSPRPGSCRKRSSTWMRHEAGMNSSTRLQTRACSRRVPPPANPSLCRLTATKDKEYGSGWAIGLAVALNAEVRPLCHRIDKEFLKRSC